MAQPTSPLLAAILHLDGRIALATDAARALVDEPTRRHLAHIIAGSEWPALVDLGSHVATLDRLDGDGAAALLLFVRKSPASGRLSKKQFEVARLAAQGKRIRDVAEVLGCSANTVKSHLRAVYDALGVCNRVQLARELTSLQD